MEETDVNKCNRSTFFDFVYIQATMTGDVMNAAQEIYAIIMQQ